MFSNLISVPLRLLDPLPIREALTEIIKKDFFQPASSFSGDLNRIQQLHDYVSSQTSNSDLDTLESALYEYFYLAGDISSKFPNTGITVTWYGTLGYKPAKSLISSWDELQASIVHQLGSLYCQKAFKESQYSDEGIKAACSYFKLSAGCYEYLRTLKMPGKDYEDATLQSLQWLMLAQAQELTWNKAISNTSMKNTVIARLAIKVSEMYATALEFADKSDSIILDWINQFKVKKNHFRAAAQYRMSIVVQDNFEYGNQVAYLTEASSLCTEAAKYKRYVNAAVVEDLQGLATVVNETLRGAQKENDLVYLKPVPSARDLPPILGVSMVSSEIPAKLIERGDIPKAFAALLPFSIIQVAQAFKERYEQFISHSFHDPTLALTRMLGKFLTDNDLPASIDTLQKPESMPTSIVHHAQEIMSIGGITLIESSMTEISKLAAQAEDLIHSCEERLRMEKYEDDLMREREGSSRWNRPPSEVAGGQYTTKLDRMKQYWELGHQSDLLIGENYASIRTFLEIYCGGKDSLNKAIPRSSHSNLSSPVATSVAELRDLLGEADALEKSRHRFLSSIDIKARDHSILPAILNEFKKNPSQYQDSKGKVDAVKLETIYERHIRFFGSDLKFLEKLKEQQIDLEKKIQEANDSFSQARTVDYDQSQRKRLEVLQSFEEAYVQYLELVSNLNQASKFYTDFLEKGNVVLRELDEFLYSRREEAQKLEISIHNSDKFNEIERSMSNSASSLPAPRGQKVNTWDPSKGIQLT